MEGALSGVKAIALSYAFFTRDNDPEIVGSASELSVRLIAHLYDNWPADKVDLYSINVPLVANLDQAKILYTDILANTWGSCFEASDVDAVDENVVEAEDREQRQLKTNKRESRWRWKPSFQRVYQSVQDSQPGNDGHAIQHGNVSVTPLKANFQGVDSIKGEIHL